MTERIRDSIVYVYSTLKSSYSDITNSLSETFDFIHVQNFQDAAEIIKKTGCPILLCDDSTINSESITFITNLRKSSHIFKLVTIVYDEISIELVSEQQVDYIHKYESNSLNSSILKKLLLSTIEYSKIIIHNKSLIKNNKSLSQSLIKSIESDKFKSQFLTNISHEIRTPLNSIIGFVSILSNTELQDPRQRNFLKYLNSSSEQILRVINSVYSLSLIESGKLKLNIEKINFKDLIIGILSSYETEIVSKNLELISEIPDINIEIISDKEKISQIVNNLLSNAVKFTNEGYIKISLKVNSNSIQLYIEDSGIGIPKNQQEYIFEQYKQEETNDSQKYGGNRVGLRISKAYADILNSSISFESEPNKGSTFVFSIPYSKDNNELKDKNLVQKNNYSINWSEKTILIAEDEPINYYYLEQVLTKTRAKIIRATNGLEAVEICNSNPFINIVLMDIKMPVMDGIEATKLIKSQFPNLPIIAQTAHAMISDREKVIKAGCDHYLKKPIKRDDLLGLLTTILG